MENQKIPSLKELLQNNEFFKMVETEKKGKAAIAIKDIPASTNIINEKSLFYFDSTCHPPSILNCQICLEFYGGKTQEEQEQNENLKFLKQQFRGHLGYVHLIAEIISSPQEKQKLFMDLDFCPTNIEESDNLKQTKEFIEKSNGWDSYKQGIFDRLVSNSHGQTNPPDCGTFMKGSMFNHSCQNNSFYFIENRTMTVRTFRDIKEGEEITISYIKDLYKPRTFRQSELAYRGFKCACTRCANSQEITRIWKCPKCQDGDFTPYNNTAVFKCQQCEHQENYLKQAKTAEKDFDMQILHKKHFKIHQDMDQTLTKNGFAIPEDIFEGMALQLIKNNNFLFKTNHHPENISLYDVIAQRFGKEQMTEKCEYYYTKAYEESVAIFGENTIQSQMQKEKIKNPPQQCSIF